DDPGSVGGHVTAEVPDPRARRIRRSGGAVRREAVPADAGVLDGCDCPAVDLEAAVDRAREAAGGSGNAAVDLVVVDAAAGAQEGAVVLDPAGRGLDVPGRVARADTVPADGRIGDPRRRAGDLRDRDAAGARLLLDVGRERTRNRALDDGAVVVDGAVLN